MLLLLLLMLLLLSIPILPLPLITTTTIITRHTCPKGPSSWSVASSVASTFGGAFSSTASDDSYGRNTGSLSLMSSTSTSMDCVMNWPSPSLSSVSVRTTVYSSLICGRERMRDAQRGRQTSEQNNQINHMLINGL